MIHFVGAGPGAPDLITVRGMRLIDMYIIVNPSAKLQDTSMNVQKAVKAAVQNMTGRVVTKVDVTVSGIAADDEESEP